MRPGNGRRLREELGRSGVKNTDDAKETDRVRKELGLARDRVDKMEVTWGSIGGRRPCGREKKRA